MSYKDCIELQQLISREIAAHVKTLPAAIERDLKEAARLLDRASNLRQVMYKLTECDRAKSHEFKLVEGSGMLGDRFEEICIHCGWSHTS